MQVKKLCESIKMGLLRYFIYENLCDRRLTRIIRTNKTCAENVTLW